MCHFSFGLVGGFSVPWKKTLNGVNSSGDACVGGKGGNSAAVMACGSFLTFSQYDCPRPGPVRVARWRCPCLIHKKKLDSRSHAAATNTRE
jgi:hypothetical protein